MITLKPQQPDFQKLCEEYLWFSKTNKTPKTHRRDKIIIKNLLRAFREKPLCEITAYDLEIYKNKRINSVKPATVNREISCMKHMFNKAIQWGYLSTNSIRSIKSLKEPPGRIRYLNETGIQRLLQHCAAHIQPMVIVALNTGMRKDEILSLKWKDIDMQNRLIILTMTKNNTTRMIPVNDTLYYTLITMGPKSNGHYVFEKDNGEKYGDIKTGFKAALRRAEIEDFRFHDLRHTFASHLVMAGVDLRTVQTLMGHKGIKMTMKYSHLSNKHIKEAINKLHAGFSIGGASAGLQNHCSTPELSRPCNAFLEHHHYIPNPLKVNITTKKGKEVM